MLLRQKDKQRTTDKRDKGPGRILPRYLLGNASGYGVSASWSFKSSHHGEYISHGTRDIARVTKNSQANNNVTELGLSENA
jgi:hypothetical protein